MKKKIYKYKQTMNSIILVILLFTLGYILNSARIQNEKHFAIDNNIEKIMLFNKDFNLYSDTFLRFHDTNSIQVKINLSKKELHQLSSHFKLSSIKDENLKKSYKRLYNNLIKKYEFINQINITRNKINSYYLSTKKQKDLTEIYNFVILDKTTMTEIKKKLQENENINNTEAKNILNYGLELKRINEKLENIYTTNELNKFNTLYSNYTYSILHTAYLLIILLFILLVLSILSYVYYDYNLALSQKELNRFRKTVEDSDNIIMITDVEMKITYVNTSFSKVTGYTKEEVVGKHPRFLNARKQPKEFYQKLKNKIYEGKKWNGQFINKNKDGKLSYQNATISPVFEDDKIIEFIAIKSDVTNETLGQEELIKKEKLLLQQSKMAALGEMLQNIAHQWRQPLSAISTASTGLIVKKEFNLPTSKEEDIQVLNSINDATQHLSETINAFRDFFQPNKEKVTFKISDIYQKTLNILLSQFQSLEIEIIEDIEDITITHLDNELIQVLMNLLNNSKDILEIKPNQKKLIFIDIFKEDQNLIIIVKDNGGGIDTNILDKVFEPYFTTKHKAHGTGIGLYMCQEIIRKHMNGYLTVDNQSFTYKNIPYSGAQFTIKFPIN